MNTDFFFRLADHLEPNPYGQDSNPCEKAVNLLRRNEPAEAYRCLGQMMQDKPDADLSCLMFDLVLAMGRRT